MARRLPRPAPSRGGMYTRDHMRKMIDTVQAHHTAMVAGGHIDHFGRPVDPQPPVAAAPEPVTHPGHCMKCRKPVDAVTESVEVEANGAHRAVGSCPTCGTKVHRFMSADDGTRLKQALDTTYAYASGGSTSGRVRTA